MISTHRVRTSIIAIAASSFASPALAQDATDPNAGEGEIVVSGIRQSLEDALNTKKNNNKISDVISAEDIGKLPDLNVAEAMQRVTGVQIGRDETGAGSNFQIRGLSNNNVEVNGRQIASNGGDTRSNSFNTLGSQLFKEIEVVKSQTADLIEGSIGGTVKLKTYRPLDFRKFTISGQAQVSDTELTKPGYLFSGLIAKPFDTGMGRIGILLNGAYERRNVTAEGVAVDWRVMQSQQQTKYPGISTTYSTFRPGQVLVERRPFEFDQISLDGMVQWEATPNLEFFVQGTYSQYDRDRAQNRFIYVLTSNNSAGVTSPQAPVLSTYTRPAFGTEFTCTNPSQPATCASAGSTVSRDLLLAGELTRTPDRTAANFEQYKETQQAYAGGFKYTGSPIQVEFQYSYSKARVDRDALNHALNLTTGLAGTLSQPGARWDFTDGADLPSISLVFPTGAREEDNPSAYTLNNFSGQLGYSVNTQNAAALDFDWDTGANFVRNIAFGMRWSENNIRRFQQRIGGAGGLTIGGTNNLGTIQQNSPDAVGDIYQLLTPPVLDGYTGDIVRQWIVPVFDQRQDLNDYARATAPGLYYFIDPYYPYDITENVFAGYVMADFEGNLGVPFTGNAGVRLVETSVKGYACTLPVPGDTITAFGRELCHFDSLQQGNPGTPGPIPVTDNVDSNSYFKILPSANITFSLQPDLLLRLAASRAMSRPNPSDLAPSRDIAQGGTTGRQGNPRLQPFESDNFDVSLEWYVNRSTAFTAAAFLKKVRNFTELERFIFSFDEDNSGTIDDDEDFSITRPVNGGSGTIKGFELNAQVTFDFLPGFLDGLGFSANYTYTDSSQNSGFDELTGEQLPIPGLSKHAYNLVAFYEKYGLSLRAAYNWRSRNYEGGGPGSNDLRLYSVDQDQLALGRTVYIPYSAALSNFNAPYAQLDLSASYQIVKGVTVFGQWQNVNNELKTQYYSVPEALGNVTDTGSIMRAGIRFRF
ncbi:Vitamin B12 transporter BtuB [Tsuneonella dongtanensis]|uniref:Vitamin B12 transporter BtuB n=1 Tax=Tsuneonella dongtanensis TaxID=692370 RepID=A0A1B2AB57_9SPHN|nr:TonB-dependent receptor [Tsuneonella dongtanensis]ANY19344.1 Vitamin B12 transporter BtuB [Tsuneonella dongtanensis]